MRAAGHPREGARGQDPGRGRPHRRGQVDPAVARGPAVRRRWHRARGRHPLRDWDLDHLRTSLGYVPQDSFLFSAPYEDNIRFGADGELSDEQIHTLVRRAAMEEEVRSFPDGYKQRVGERGVTLSGGQRQRTCIARALAKDPRILILDDCLSAVDTETEKTLLKELRQAGESRTVLVAAHRLSSVVAADQILVLDENGHQADLGTHAELVARPGWYRETWQRQQRRAHLLEDRV
ncbi:MAG: ATP-binding cassette domain-containing protein [Planctomycetota bacterium]